jgi:hypothetical protein
MEADMKLRDTIVIGVTAFAATISIILLPAFAAGSGPFA